MRAAIKKTNDTKTAFINANDSISWKFQAKFSYLLYINNLSYRAISSWYNWNCTENFFTTLALSLSICYRHRTTVFPLLQSVQQIELNTLVFTWSINCYFLFQWHLVFFWKKQGQKTPEQTERQTRLRPQNTTNEKWNTAGRLPENSRNSFVDLSQKDRKRKTKKSLLNAEMLFLLRICISKGYFYSLLSNNLQLEWHTLTWPCLIELKWKVNFRV